MKIFITGITGTLGQAVCQKLLTDPTMQIVGFSKDEKRQSELKSHPRVTLVLGCIRDRQRIIEQTRKSDLIFHFAAMKRVEMAQMNPEEAIDTNIQGTRNVLAAQRANNTARVILSSTDKACRPINVYGYSKAVSEELVLRNNNNVVVRYGNVLASNGSAVIDFIKSIQKSGEVNITHPEMTRFFMTIENAADFVIQSAFSPKGGLRVYRNMKSCRMVDLIQALGDLLEVKRVKMNTIGKRPGEKIHEDLWHHDDKGMTGFLTSETAEKFTVDELKRLLLPVVKKIASKKATRILLPTMHELSQ